MWEWCLITVRAVPGIVCVDDGVFIRVIALCELAGWDLKGKRVGRSGEEGRRVVEERGGIQR